MTIPKELVVTGTKVVVDNQGTGMNREVVLTRKPGGALDDWLHPAVGDELEILSLPRKYEGINCVKVKYGNSEMFAYYTHIRFSTSLR